MERKRPKSSINPRTAQRSCTHATPPKTYRVNQQDVYNYVRNSVHQTFKGGTNRNYQLIKQYTNSNGIENLNKKSQIDRLCRKYCILKSSRGKALFEGEQINVQQITARYVKSKSKDRQKEEVRKRLKGDISKNYRYGTKPQYLESEQFFSFQGPELSTMEKKQRLRRKQNQQSIKPHYKHPYLQIYQNTQKQVLENRKQLNSIEIMSEYPALPDMQEWEKNTHNLKRVFEGPPSRKKKMRQIKSARERESVKEVSFYLT